jgi:hypothetical protein
MDLFVAARRVHSAAGGDRPQKSEDIKTVIDCELAQAPFQI